MIEINGCTQINTVTGAWRAKVEWRDPATDELVIVVSSEVETYTEANELMNIAVKVVMKRLNLTDDMCLINHTYNGMPVGNA